LLVGVVPGVLAMVQCRGRLKNVPFGILAVALSANTPEDLTPLSDWIKGWGGQGRCQPETTRG